jgi:hypothetical protein
LKLTDDIIIILYALATSAFFYSLGTYIRRRYKDKAEIVELSKFWRFPNLEYQWYNIGVFLTSFAIVIIGILVAILLLFLIEPDW